MESIKIDGFLTISKAHFEIKKINILIGAQASGKSVIAKLVYFFKNFFSEIFIESVEKLGTKRDIGKQCLEKFEQIFPKYSWEHQDFSIVYEYGLYQVSLSRNKSRNRDSIKFDYCKELQDLHKTLKLSYKQAIEEFEQSSESTKRKQSFKHRNILFDAVYSKIKNTDFEEGFQNTIFIPASRSFFANLQKNVFSFLASNMDFDPFIKEFGSQYENSKRFHNSQIFRDQELQESTKKKVDNLIKSIISGEYIFSEDKDWISNDGKRINLANASSGQQESLPMLLILSMWPFIYGNDKSAMFFIEEPEAHLFPMSQKQIISILATIYHSFNHSFFITTHSPYILTAINNLVMGRDAYEKVAENSKEKALLAAKIPFDETIRYEDISAYTINTGQLQSITDIDSRLIGASIIDTVSESFDEAFDIASSIVYG